MWGHSHREVKTVDKGHSIRGEVVVAVVEGNLCQSGRGGSTEAVAFDFVVAITCGALKFAVGVGAASAAPDPA